MKNETNKYLSTAKSNLNTEPLFDKAGLRSILDGESGSILYKQSKLKSLLKRKLPMTILSTAVTALIISFIVFTGGQEAQVSEHKLQKRPVTGPSSGMASGSSVQLITNEETVETTVKYSRVLVLTDKELEKLGIIKTENGYKVRCEKKFNDRILPDLYDYGYDTSAKNVYYTVDDYIGSSIHDRIIRFDDPDRIREGLVSPIKLLLREYSSENNLARHSAGGSDRGLNAGPAFTEERHQFGKYKPKIRGEVVPVLDKLLRDEKQYPYMSKLVPVYIEMPNESGGLKDLFLWYIPTKEFMEKIPERYRKALADEVETIASLERIEYVEEAYAEQQREREKNISSIEMVNLTMEEGRKLGLDFKDGVFSYITDTEMHPDKWKQSREYDSALRVNGYDPAKIKYIRMKNTMDAYGTGGDILKYGGWDLNEKIKIEPLSVTCRTYYYMNDDMKRHTVRECMRSFDLTSFGGNISLDVEKDKQGKKKFLWDGNEVKYDMNKLIPVYIKIDNFLPGAKLENYMELVLWYVPNKDFIDALPERYSSRLRNELDIIKGIESGAVDKKDACMKLEGEKSFFDICQSNAGTFKDFSIFPNPASGNTNCKVVLDQARSVTISIHELSGKQISNLVTNSKMKKGKNDISLDISSLNSGVYLVAATSAKGEQIVTKLIVK